MPVVSLSVGSLYVMILTPLQLLVNGFCGEWRKNIMYFLPFLTGSVR